MFKGVEIVAPVESVAKLPVMQDKEKTLTKKATEADVKSPGGVAKKSKPVKSSMKALSNVRPSIMTNN